MVERQGRGTQRRCQVEAESSIMPSGVSGLPNTEMFTIATDGYLPFVLNLQASLESVGMSRALTTFALDDNTFAELERSGLRVQRHEIGAAPSWSKFGSPEFARMMSFKYEIALGILATGRRALYVDSDIIFLRDPSDHLAQVLEDVPVDLVMQLEVPAHLLNAGFWIANPTPRTFALFRFLRDNLDDDRPYVDDQKTINEWVRIGDRLTAHGLDPQLFACGNQFLPGRTVEEGGVHIDRSNVPFPREAAYLLHFNFLVSKKQKLAAMAKHNAILHESLAEVMREESGPVVARLLRRALGEH